MSELHFQCSMTLKCAEEYLYLQTHSSPSYSYISTVKQNVCIYLSLPGDQDLSLPEGYHWCTDSSFVILKARRCNDAEIFFFLNNIPFLLDIGVLSHSKQNENSPKADLKTPHEWSEHFSIRCIVFREIMCVIS